jgi:hypothetical protein
VGWALGFFTNDSPKLYQGDQGVHVSIVEPSANLIGTDASLLENTTVNLILDSFRHPYNRLRASHSPDGAGPDKGLRRLMHTFTVVLRYPFGHDPPAHRLNGLSRVPIEY